MKGKYLITTSEWFIAPDGQQYRAVYGEVEVLEDSFLGVKTNRNASNWFIKVGNATTHIIVAGCQIHYAIKTDKEPHSGDIEDWSLNNDKTDIVKYKRSGSIYIVK